MKPQTKHTNLEPTMKKSIAILALVVLSFALVQSAMAQTTTQTVNINVNKVYKVAIVGGAVNLTLTTGVAGTNALTPATDASTTYSVTQNNSTSTHMTAQLDAAMPKGKLEINVAGGLGTTAGLQDLTAGTAKTVVTAMALGAASGTAISYTLNANASEGIFTDSKTVTFTIVD
jgi:hypothetical protein